MIQNTNDIVSDKQGVLPSVGIILLFIIVVIVFNSIVIGSVIFGSSVVSEFIDITKYILPIFLVIVIARSTKLVLEKQRQTNTTLQDVIKVESETKSTFKDDIPVNKLKMLTVSIDTIHETSVENYLTVAPENANPRNWPRKLAEQNDVTFVLNCNQLPDTLSKDGTIITPDEAHFKTNAFYQSGEVDSLTIYDKDLTEVGTYKFQD